MPERKARVDFDADNERLLIAAAQRDPARFAELYDRNFEHVYAYIASRTGERHLAEDLTSEVFHHALAHLAGFEWRGTPFCAWLLRIARNELADHWKRSRHESGQAAPEPAGEDAALAEVEQRATLFRLAGELSEDQRRVIVMRFVEEKSIREIARALKRSEGAVKQLQLRALENLRKRLEAGHD